LLNDADCLGFLFGCELTAGFLSHVNILLDYQLFETVHFFGVRSAEAG